MASVFDRLFALQGLGMKLNIDNIRELLNRLGNPQDSFRSVHVAGTNGKGSVSSMLASILRESGYRTGLFTSPHLVRFNERIQVDGVQISDEEVERYFSILEPHMTEMENESKLKKITFFEATTAMAFLYFADRKVDYAVVEVGLGGRLDATNVIIPELSVITSISLDHTRILGDRVEKIAGEKAGIIKNGIPVVLARNEQAVVDVIERISAEKHAPLTLVGRDSLISDPSYSLDFARCTMRMPDSSLLRLETPMGGEYQVDNCATAATAAWRLGIGADAIRSGLKRARWPGRMEILRREPLLLIDGCHNKGGAQSLLETLRSEGIEGLNFIMAFSSERRERDILSVLEPLMTGLTVTAPDNPRAIDVDEAMKIAVDVLGDRVAIRRASTVADALKDIDGDTCITGSLYLLGEAIPLLKSEP